MQVEFTQPPTPADIRSTLDGAGIRGAEIQQFGSDREFTVRAQDQRDVAQQASGAESVAHAHQQRARRASSARRRSRVVRTEAVGPRVGAELRRNAGIAMLLASLVTLIYLAIRFEWRFGVAAVLVDRARHPRHARVHQAAAHRGLADRRRGDPHAARLLGERHDHHLRSRAREPARRTASRRSTTCSTARSTRRCRGRC